MTNLDESKSRPTLAVVIPMRNEAVIVRDTVQRVMQALAAIDVEATLICVDDGSADDTWANCATWRRTTPASSQ